MLSEAVLNLLEDMQVDLLAKDYIKPDQKSILALKESRFRKGDESLYAMWMVLVTDDKELRDDWVKIIKKEQEEWAVIDISCIPGLDIPKEE